MFHYPKQWQAYSLQITQHPLVFVLAPLSALPTTGLYLGVITDRIITVDKTRLHSAHRWLPSPNSNNNINNMNSGNSTPGNTGSSSNANSYYNNSPPFTFELDPLLEARRK